MADNVKIPYYVRENNKVGTHSVFAQPQSKGTYGFERMCKKAAEKTTIEPHTVRAAVEEYINIAKEALKEGYRVDIGQDFVQLYPNLRGSLKDELNADGTVKRAVTPKDLKIQHLKSRVGATVDPDFSDEFAKAVSWQRTDRQGNVIDDEDATETNEEQTGDNTTGGSTSNPDPDAPIEG